MRLESSTNRLAGGGGLPQTCNLQKTQNLQSTIKQSAVK